MPSRTRARRRGCRPPAFQREHREWLTLTALADVGPDNPVANALVAAAESVQQLSLRNQLMLLIQAGEKHLQLRDIDTAAGWARRGRAVRGAGLSIIYPFERPGTGPGGRRTFRADARWEFTQTVLLGGAIDSQTAPHPAGDPRAFADHLATQVRQCGYQVGPGPETAVDLDRRLVTIDEPVWHAHSEGAARVLLTVLAQLIVGDQDAITAAWGGPRSRPPSAGRTTRTVRSSSARPTTAGPPKRPRRTEVR